MRWTCSTPDRTSRFRVSKSTRAPTAASTVCRSPVVRCTEKPIRIRCSTTCWICSSLADSCMATIMVVVSRQSLVVNRKPPLSVWLTTNDQRLTASSIIHLRVQLRITRALCCWLGSDLFLLNLAHDIHDAFVNAQQVTIRQRALIHLAHIAEYGLLTIRLVDGHTDVPFEFADFMGGLRPLVQQLHQLPVQLVDHPTPVRDIHRSSRQSSVFSRQNSVVCRWRVVVQPLLVRTNRLLF